MLDPAEMLSFDADTASAYHGDDDVIAVFACFLFSLSVQALLPRKI